MNREIKFRAWDSKDKYMLDDSYGNWISFDGVIYEDAGRKYDTPNIEIEKSKGLILMQFTGLKDKNGKEIYEGDIVKFIGGTCNYLPCGIYSYQKHEIGAILCIQRLPSGFTLRLPHHYGKDEVPNMVGNVDNYTFWNHQHSFEVIGNIYENPELLEK